LVESLATRHAEQVHFAAGCDAAASFEKKDGVIFFVEVSTWSNESSVCFGFGGAVVVVLAVEQQAQFVFDSSF
jgi:hypothetical protein